MRLAKIDSLKEGLDLEGVEGQLVAEMVEASLVDWELHFSWEYFYSIVSDVWHSLIIIMLIKPFGVPDFLQVLKVSLQLLQDLDFPFQKVTTILLVFQRFK